MKWNLHGKERRLEIKETSQSAQTKLTAVEALSPFRWVCFLEGTHVKMGKGWLNTAARASLMENAASGAVGGSVASPNARGRPQSDTLGIPRDRLGLSTLSLSIKGFFLAIIQKHRISQNVMFYPKLIYNFRTRANLTLLLLWCLWTFLECFSQSTFPL